MRRLLSAISLALLSLLVVAAGSPADRKPSDREKAKLTKAFDKAGFSCDVFPDVRCTRKIRVSTVNERWAAASIKGDPSVVQQAAASALRKNHRWRVQQVGNGGGCDAPSAVREDLNLGCVP